jgi:hypothetical protein
VNFGEGQKNRKRDKKILSQKLRNYAAVLNHTKIPNLKGLKK